jgi:hypothetical protein
MITIASKISKPDFGFREQSVYLEVRLPKDDHVKIYFSVGIGLINVRERTYAYSYVRDRVTHDP